MNLSESTVLVTGGAHRLGKAVSLAVAERGARVAVHYHSSSEPAAETVRSIAAAGGRARAVGGDAADATAMAHLIDTAEAELGPIDAWIACAGVFRRTPPDRVAADDWHAMLRGNFETFAVPAAILGPRMRSRGAGAMIAISDVAAVRPWVDYLPYCVAKSRLLHHADGLARELAPAVRVNTILPGPVLFPPDYPADARKREISNTLLQREGSAEDIARACLFLLENDYLTGAHLPVDGGRLLA